MSSTVVAACGALDDKGVIWLLSIVVGRVRLAEKKLKRDTLVAFGIRPAAIK
jgi:hypothetical protein